MTLRVCKHSNQLCSEIFVGFVLCPLAGAKHCNQFVHNVHTICTDHHFSQVNGRIATKLAHDGLQVSLRPWCAQGQGQRSRDTGTVKVKVKGHVIRALLYWHKNRFLTIIGNFGIRGIIHYSRQVCNLLFLAFQYSSPGGSTTAGEVCYLRLPCFIR